MFPLIMKSCFTALALMYYPSIKLTGYDTNSPNRDILIHISILWNNHLLICIMSGTQIVSRIFSSNWHHDNFKYSCRISRHFFKNIDPWSVRKNMEHCPEVSPNYLNPPQDDSSNSNYMIISLENRLSHYTVEFALFK